MKQFGESADGEPVLRESNTERSQRHRIPGNLPVHTQQPPHLTSLFGRQRHFQRAAFQPTTAVDAAAYRLDNQCGAG
ncbi:hypothetical protein ACWEH3_17910 [Nocardia sp. NPDC004718]